MSTKVFQDKIFPRHVSDLMNLMHMVVFTGSDGEETWKTWLSLKQKEYAATALAQYYQCEHCIEFHQHSLTKLETVGKTTFAQNLNSMVLFLRVDTRIIGKQERQHWVKTWTRFAKRVAQASNDPALPYIIGLAIGIARNDEFLIQFCGSETVSILTAQGLDARAAIGELEAVIIFMKAAVSKNRVVDKIDRLFQEAAP